MSDKAHPDPVLLDQIRALITESLNARRDVERFTNLCEKVFQRLREVLDNEKLAGEAKLTEARQFLAGIGMVGEVAQKLRSFAEAADKSDSWDAKLPITSPERLMDEAENLRREIKLSGDSEPIWLCFAAHCLRGFWESMAAIKGDVPDIPPFLDRDWRLSAVIMEGQTLEGLRVEEVFNACNDVVRFAKRTKVGDGGAPVFQTATDLAKTSGLLAGKEDSRDSDIAAAVETGTLLCEFIKSAWKANSRQDARAAFENLREGVKLTMKREMNVAHFWLEPAPSWDSQAASLLDALCRLGRRLVCHAAAAANCPWNDPNFPDKVAQAWEGVRHFVAEGYSPTGPRSRPERSSPRGRDHFPDKRERDSEAAIIHKRRLAPGFPCSD